MKILVVKRTPLKRFLVELHTNKLVREVATLIGRRRHSQAVAITLAKGRLEKEVTDSDLKNVKADVILTEESDE